MATEVPLIGQTVRSSIKDGSPLFEFSDSVGTEGSGAETFVTMFVKNVEEITVNLGGKYEAFSASDAKESGK